MLKLLFFPLLFFYLFICIFFFFARFSGCFSLIFPSHFPSAPLFSPSLYLSKALFPTLSLSIVHLYAGWKESLVSHCHPGGLRGDAAIQLSGRRGGKRNVCTCKIKPREAGNRERMSGKWEKVEKWEKRRRGRKKKKKGQKES